MDAAKLTTRNGRTRRASARSRAKTHAAWLRDAAAALRASRDLAVRLEHLGHAPTKLAVIRLRIDHALLEVDFLLDATGRG